MQLNILAFAVPFFLFFMYVEYLFIVKKGGRYSSFNELVSNISIGIAERLSDVLAASLFYFVYDYLQKKWGFFSIKPSVFLWIILLIITDFIWYWYHRLAHEINLLWALHVVHHQSEDFNYTVSARITFFQALARTGFWCILPIIGFPASMITSILLVHGLYPFFIHTKAIGKLGVLEYILVTPSHHRVHHASNPNYLDKNYGDVLIIWDKLFGTFKKEGNEPIVYGLTQPLQTFSFLWQHFHFFIELWIAIKKEKSFSRKIKILFGKPNTLSYSLRAEAELYFNIHQNKEAIQEKLNRYVVWQMVLLLISLFAFILFEHYFTVFQIMCIALIIVLTLINCGAIMEKKRWIFQVEFLRCIIVFSLFGFAFLQTMSIYLIVIAVFLLTISYNFLKHQYLLLVYKSI